MKENKNRNYDLKSDAVETLAGADSAEIPEYSQEELQKYRSRSGIRIPNAVKMPFIKAWFAGAVCFFFFWGLGTYVSGLIDMLFILCVALGMVTDLLTNNVIRFLEKNPGESSRWLLVTRRGAGGFFLNILSSFAIVFCVYMLYNLINYAVISITGNADSVPLGVEPVLFGVFSMAFDMLLIGIKRLFIRILQDAKAGASR